MKTVRDFEQEIEALLDRAQRERRHLTPEEEAQAAKLARLRALLLTLEGENDHDPRASGASYAARGG